MHLQVFVVTIILWVIETKYTSLSAKLYKLQ
jgi:hypothetical protein